MKFNELKNVAVLRNLWQEVGAVHAWKIDLLAKNEELCLIQQWPQGREKNYSSPAASGEDHMFA